MTEPGPTTEPTDPRQVDTAYVLKDGVLAATLTRTEGAVEFAYETTYLESGGRAVATTLPLTDEPVRTVAGAVSAFFANLLPEGRRLTALRRSVKTSTDDELSLLLAVGADPVGDVQVLPDPHEQTEQAAAVVTAASRRSTSPTSSRRRGSATLPSWPGFRTRCRDAC